MFKQVSFVCRYPTSALRSRKMCVGRMNRRPQVLVPDLPVREDHIFRQDEAVWTLATGRAQEIEVSLGVVVASSREGNQDLYRIHWPGFAWKDDYIVQKEYCFHHQEPCESYLASVLIDCIYLS